MKFAIALALVAFLAVYVSGEQLGETEQPEHVEQFEPFEQLRNLARFSKY